ncbi:flagellar biosynthesis protein [Terribacillus aidingensis]|uniref:Flagellar biosynthesis protein n=1 Tax=Terribacillus aidingensis TaxID=586416 RepID=A0A285NJB6_9BACI|nr:EscU/YscU/HrcU family type III secretion system export apparatus switch protein [Terribacillus aidingensis]SNZ09580.1 flagellar biosynthesis protein [Terribacillus aidingensis]
MTDKHPVRQAAALKYDTAKQHAPVLTASGRGLTAEAIIKRAEDNGVPIQQDPALVGLLGELKVNDAIPADLYEAVAEVFAFIYKADRQAGE